MADGATLEEVPVERLTQASRNHSIVGAIVMRLAPGGRT